MGATTAAVVASMLIAMLSSTFLLVAIFKYDCKKRDVSFDNFWRRRCDDDWQLAFTAFTYGIPLFSDARAGWVGSVLVTWEQEYSLYICYSNRFYHPSFLVSFDEV